MAFEVTEIQPTPNPNAVKFILDKPITEFPTSFFNAQAAQGHVLAERLFAIPGVSCLLLLGDFVTVNKRPEVRWDAITGRVREILKDSD
jgi:hypothetical protein